MIYKPFQSISLSRLGMGNMRLPSTDPKDPNAPIDQRCFSRPWLPNAPAK